MTKAEKIILALTLVFVVFAVVYHFTADRGAPMTVTTGVSMQTPAERELLNLNTATAEELTALPGLGELVAGEILAYRDSSGPFRDVEELRAVPGMNDMLFDMIKDHICVK